ncbi:MAG: alpha/beta hydrolase [Actinomycetota bacterium]|nr:alpha/beta hydrolase [Actinomycetota bacterium]
MITTSDGVALHLFDEGSGAPVVLIAGYGAPAAAWYLQVDALRDEHRCISVDRRHHGRSGRPAYGHRMSRHAADVREVIDELALRDVLLVGSSMGANVALSYVDLFGTSTLRGLVLVDQTPKMINEDDWELGYVGLTRDGAEEWVGRFPEGVRALHVQPPAEVLVRTQDGPPFSVDDTRALLRDHTFADWRDVVARVDVPVTAIAGRESPVWPWQSSAWLAETAPDGHLVVIDDCGHAPMVEQPAAFNRALREAAAR